MIIPNIWKKYVPNHQPVNLPYPISPSPPPKPNIPKASGTEAELAVTFLEALGEGMATEMASSWNATWIMADHFWTGSIDNI